MDNLELLGDLLNIGMDERYSYFIRINYKNTECIKHILISGNHKYIIDNILMHFKVNIPIIKEENNWIELFMRNVISETTDKDKTICTVYPMIAKLSKVFFHTGDLTLDGFEYFEDFCDNLNVDNVIFI